MVSCLQVGLASAISTLPYVAAFLVGLQSNLVSRAFPFLIGKALGTRLVTVKRVKTWPPDKVFDNFLTSFRQLSDSFSLHLAIQMEGLQETDLSIVGKPR